MSWLQIALDVDTPRLEVAERALNNAGALAITLLDPGGEPILEPAPGEMPLWAEMRLVALFDSGTDAFELHRQVRDALGGAPREWTAEILEDRAWERAWLDDYRPLRFGDRLWIVPTPLEPVNADAINLRLDPGLAFGSGTHPTTGLCLEWLADHPPVGLDVVDYGCGSGVLAIAALKLGAHRAHAVDTDAQALTASHDNATNNGVAPSLRLSQPAEAAIEPGDVVLANILAGTLIELTSALTACTRIGGALVLSGILERQGPAVRSAFEPAFVWEPPALRDGWVRLVGRRRL